MSKSFSVTFDLLGHMDGSLVAALQAAQNRMKALAETANSLNGKSLKLAQRLQNSQGLLKNVEAYNKLNAAMNSNIAQQAKLRADSAKLLQQRGAEQKKLADMQAAYSQLQQVYRSNKKSMGTDAAAAMKSQLAAARAEIKAQQQAVNGLGTAFDTTSQKVAKLQAQISQQQAKLTQLRTTIPTGNIAAAEAALRSQIQSTTAALNQEIAALQRRNQLQSNFNQSSQNLSNAYSNFQNSVDSAKTIMSPFVAATENAMEFEHSMSRVKALTQSANIREGNFSQVNREMKQLTDQAKMLGATTMFTSTQAAQAMGFLGRSCPQVAQAA